MPQVNSRRVLIVEDHEDSAYLLAEVLTARGHDVRVALDASSGLAVASSESLDVIVLDIGLPEMDGYELARRMRALPGIATGVRFIALTGYGGAEHIELARNAGFDVHLLKPVSPDALARAIQD
jgi:CheY-like chemotaxis protein